MKHPLLDKENFMILDSFSVISKGDVVWFDGWENGEKTVKSGMVTNVKDLGRGIIIVQTDNDGHFVLQTRFFLHEKPPCNLKLPKPIK